MFQIIMSILLILNGMLVEVAPPQEYSNSLELKALAWDFGNALAPYFEEVGAPVPKITPLHFEIFPRGDPMGATWVTWGSHSCEAFVVLHAPWLYSHRPFFGTPMWRAVLAHEWAHVGQGPYCWPKASEADADLTGYAALYLLSQSDDKQSEKAWVGFIQGMHHEFLQAALTLSMKDGHPRSYVLDQLQLTEKERYFYDHIPTSKLFSSASVYSIPLIESLLEDEDGLYKVLSPTQTLDATELWMWVQGLNEN